MSYKREREFFLQRFGAEFPRAPMETAQALLRCATSAQRYNEIASSIEVSERESARLEARDKRNTERARRLAESLDAELIENGDPRGFPFLLACPSGRTYDWGSRGLGIPGRGLPARAFQ